MYKNIYDSLQKITHLFKDPLDGSVKKETCPKKIIAMVNIFGICWITKIIACVSLLLSNKKYSFYTLYYINISSYTCITYIFLFSQYSNIELFEVERIVQKRWSEGKRSQKKGIFYPPNHLDYPHLDYSGLLNLKLAEKW